MSTITETKIIETNETAEYGKSFTSYIILGSLVELDSFLSKDEIDYIRPYQYKEERFNFPREPQKLKDVFIKVYKYLQKHDKELLDESIEDFDIFFRMMDKAISENSLIDYSWSN